MFFTQSRITKFLALTPLLLGVASAAVPAMQPASAAIESRDKARLVSLPVPFVANSGEVDRDVAFYARTFAGTVFVTRDARVVYALPARSTTSPDTPAGWALTETFPSAPAVKTPIGGSPSASRVSRFTYRTAHPGEVSTFDDIRLGEVAPGIDARLRATGNNVEKLFSVGVGADASALRIRVGGSEKLAVRSDGSLAATTGLGDIVFTAPIAWQERDGGRTPVDVRYVLAGSRDYGFALGVHDRSLPVVIDPLIRSTFSGGAGDDVVRAITVHPGTNSVYVAGYTKSTSFPGTAGPLPGGQSSPNAAGGQEAFVAQYNPGLTALVRASYYGGDGVEEAKAIAIHPNTGDVYIAGTTTSNSGTLLNATGTFAGQVDGFIARFDGALNAIPSARFYGGSGIETIWGLVIDPTTGDVIVAGDTTSTDLPLGAAGSVQLTNAGGQDAFVARFSSNLTALIRATYYGGTGTDRALSLALDIPTGDVIIAGVTTSTTLTNVATGAFPSFGGGTDGFVARLDGNLSAVRISTFFGGTDLDQINGVAVHPLNGDIYVAGETRSIAIVAPSGAQSTLGGGLDGFVARFPSDLTGIRVFTYFGKLGDDAVKAIAISRWNGEIYIAGSTDSQTIPASPIDGPQTVRAGGIDAFVARLDAALVGVKQSTLLGGTGFDTAWSLALTDTTAYIGGETSSGTLPGTLNAPQIANQGGTDGFVTAFTSDLVAGNSNPAPFAFVPITNSLPSTLQVSAPTRVVPTGNTIAYVDGQRGSTWCASSAADCKCDKTGNVYVTGEALVTATTPGTPYYVCVRHISSSAPDAVTESRLHIGAVTGVFRTATGGGAGLLGCTLDVDGNGVQDALTDGLLILRALFGLTGTAVTTNAVGSNAARSSWTDIKAYLNANCGATIP